MQRRVYTGHCAKCLDGEKWLTAGDVYGITCSAVVRRGKESPMEGKKLKYQATQAHIDTHSGLGWGLWRHSSKTGRNRSVSYSISTHAVCRVFGPCSKMDLFSGGQCSDLRP